MSEHEASGPLYAYVDGSIRRVLEPHVSSLDRGFTLGDGVFDTLLVLGGRPYRLADHLARLRAAARVLELDAPESDARLRSAIDAVLQASAIEDAVVRLTVTRGATMGRGVLPPPDAVPTLVVHAAPLPERKATGIPAVRAKISTIRRNEHSPASRVKSCNYLDNILSRLEARRADADDAIMLNTAGYVACGSASNLHIVSHGRVLTPAIGCGVLAGVTRTVVREICLATGVEWHETWLQPNELLSAEEAFLTNSVLGIAPLTAVDGQPIGAGTVGPVTLRIRQEYEDTLRLHRGGQ